MYFNVKYWKICCHVTTIFDRRTQPLRGLTKFRMEKMQKYGPMSHNGLIDIHGFDQYYGLPYSNDMWPYHPNFVDLPADSPKLKNNYPPLPLFDGNEVVDAEVDPEDQTRLTTAYTERAVDFIEKNHERPFLLYLPHSMVHVPLYVSEKFAGKSGAGLFGDVMMEVDWSVGQINEALKIN